ncbi:MAG TPA: SpoIIE family protein phosphatase [Vicinamibacterales bacterium]|nr:SpoIIE family protein phosphatase [Vicinamibacterales bacterium]
MHPSSREVPAGCSPQPAQRPTDQELLTTLFDLGRQVTAVLDLEELLQRIPQLIRRLTEYQAFAAYLIDQKRGDLSIAYAVGYPAEAVRSLRLKVGEGIVGRAVAEEHPILVDDVLQDPRYVQIVPGTRSELVVPLRRKGKVIGALNLLSPQVGQFTELDEKILRQFASAVAVGIENARLFEKEREYAEMLETLAEIGREVSSILDLDELLTRLAQLIKRVIDYRTFGILLVNEATNELEMKLALKYGEQTTMPPVPVGKGLVGYAAAHKETVLVPDVTADPRYVNVVEDVRSELVIPLLVKDRCIGVFDIESPELDAFGKSHVEVMTLLASQAAVAIENARLYERVSANEERLENELRFAQRVQAAFLPTGLPRRLKCVDVAARFAPARELGGDLYDFLMPDGHTLVVAVGDVSGKGVPAALYSAFAGELIRSRTFRGRFDAQGFVAGSVLSSVNTILHERRLEEYYCTLCYAVFDIKRRKVTIANSGLPYPLRSSGGECVAVEVAGIPLGAFPGSTYDEVSFDLRAGDVFLFSTDGVFEAMDAEGNEFGSGQLLQTLQAAKDGSAEETVDAVFRAVERHRGDAAPNDDMTAVVVRITS